MSQPVTTQGGISTSSPPLAGRWVSGAHFYYFPRLHPRLVFQVAWSERSGGERAGGAVLPFCRWRWKHSVHHASAGDLGRRGTGDVWTVTVQEYLEASRWKRCAYRLTRNPVILFVVAPLVLFLVLERLPTGKEGSRRGQALLQLTIAYRV
jgi:hypothetical protein